MVRGILWLDVAGSVASFCSLGLGGEAYILGGSSSIKLIFHQGLTKSPVSFFLQHITEN